MHTADGELRWRSENPEVEVFDREGKQIRKIPLVSPSPLSQKGAVLRALLPERGEYFLVIEETRRDFGLHLAEKRGSTKAKATLVKSLLRLVDLKGRKIWEREMPDKTLIGDAGSPQSLSISNKGTVAILLQDVDPYSHNRPILSVFNPSGSEVLRLDYTAWTRIDGFALSGDGKTLSVLGFGLIPEDGEIGSALGYYDIAQGKPLWIKAAPHDLKSAKTFRMVDPEGWACCVKKGAAYSSFSRAGEIKLLSPDEMFRRFGVSP